MKTLGYYNGHIDELENLTIPALDRSVYFGDGVYDVVYSQDYNAIYLDEHIDRLYKNASLIDINPPIDKVELYHLIIDLIKKMDDGDLQIYFQFSRGSGIREHTYKDGMQGNLLIMINNKQILQDKEVECITMEDTRYLHCNLKTLNLLPSILAAKTASKANVYEVIFHRNKRVTECSHSNVHIIKGNKFITAPADNLILPGISRKHLIDKMKQDGYIVEEKEYYLQDLYEADQVLLSAAGAPILHVSKIDGIKIGNMSKK